MTALPDRMSLTEFLDSEQAQPDRWEFADGYTSPMSGTTNTHGHFGTGSLCYAYGSDRKVRVPRQTGDGERYPDATVTCTEHEHGKALIVGSPVVILEVVSDSSVSIDTVKKPHDYNAMATLVHYVLVDSRERWALSYIRRNGTWDSDFCIDEIVTIPHFGLRLRFAELYAGTTLEVTQRTEIDEVTSPPTTPAAPHWERERGM
jgi:Uma2 family endonuclease